MNNLPIQTYESVVQQRDALEKKLADCHRENLALIEQAEEVYAAGYNHGHLNTVDGIAYSAGVKDEFYQTAIELMNEAETQATDAFTRELMAKGVESGAEHFRSRARCARTLENHDRACFLDTTAEMFDDFAAKLRKGINDAQ